MSRHEKKEFTGDNTSRAVAVSSDEINLLDYLRVIFRHCWLISGITLVAMAATVLWSLRQPRMYQATTSIVPPISSQPGGMGGMASRLVGGSSLLKGMLSESDLSGLYEGILNSRALSDVLIDRFDLMKVYKGAKTRAAARARLKKHTSIETSRRDSIIYIAVTDRDPNRAAALCNGYVEELDAQNRRLSGGQSTSKRIFLENRLREIQDELSKIDTLQSREAQNKEMLFEMLARECEFAKIEEAKSMPTIQVLDKGIVPERGMARGTIQRGLVAGVVAFLLGVFLAVFLDYMVKVNKKEVAKQVSTIDPDCDMRDEATFRELEEHRMIVAAHRRKIAHEKPSACNNI
ncbi:Wzz/FepE/Etk N-terminal domain-containing protein [Planctomycetota bacterium]